MFIKSIIFALLINFSFAAPPQSFKKAKLALSNGRLINVFLAITEKEQNNGLSGWKPTQLPKDEGMLFLYQDMGIKSFWMPNTFFNLDIIYFDQNLKVLKIDRNAPHHPGYNEPIPRLNPTLAQHVLEIHANSELSKLIQPGTQLKWMGKKPIKEILRDTRRPQ